MTDMTKAQKLRLIDAWPSPIRIACIPISKRRNSPERTAPGYWGRSWSSP